MPLRAATLLLPQKGDAAPVLSPLSACGLGRRLPRTSVPHASPTPRRQAQRYASPPGEEPGRGYSARAIEIAAPLSAMELMWAHIADVPSKQLAPRLQCRCLPPLSDHAGCLCHLLCAARFGITLRLRRYSPPQSRHLAAWRAKLRARSARGLEAYSLPEPQKTRVTGVNSWVSVAVGLPMSRKRGLRVLANKSRGARAHAGVRFIPCMNSADNNAGDIGPLHKVICSSLR